MPRLTIRRKLSLTFALILIPLIALQIIMFTKWLDDRKAVTLESQRLIAVAAASNVEAFAKHLTEEEEAVGKAIIENATTPLEIRSLLQDFVFHNPHITSATFARPDGYILASYPDSSNQTLKWPASRSLSIGRPVAVSNAFMSTSAPVAEWAVSTAIGSTDGQITGIIEAHIKQSVFAELLAPTQDQLFDLAVIDRSGRLVFTNVKEDIMWDDRDWASDENIRKSLAGEDSVTGNFNRAFLLPDDSRVRMGATVPIHSLDWVMATSMLEEEALLPLQRFAYLQLGSLFFVTLLSVFVGIVSGSLLAKPLRDLRRQALTLASGDLSGRVDIRTRDEVEDLAHAFNEMADKLQNRERENQILIEQLQRTESQRRELISLVTHDLKGPLSIIKGYAGLLLRDLGSETVHPRHQRAANMIDNQTNAIVFLLDQLSAITKAEISHPLHLMNVNLVDLADRFIESFQVTTRNHTLLLRHSGAVSVTCDEQRIGQVYANLLQNAIKYSPAGSTIILEVREEGDNARVSITDQGKGIPIEEQEHIFQPFYRINSTDAERKEGSGLGLYICRQIVEKHGGRMWIEGEEGKGSTFLFSLPRIPVKEARKR